MDIRTFVDDQRALGNSDKLLKLAPRWARRAERWMSDNCRDFSEALEAAGHACRFRLKGDIVNAQSLEMTLEEIMYGIEHIPAQKFLYKQMIVNEKVFC